MTSDLMQAANTLAEVLTLENAALQRLDFPAAVALGKDKEAALLGVTTGRQPLLPADRTPALLAVGQRIKQLVADNRALLERAIAVQTRVVGIMVRAATPPPEAGHYAANGLKSPSRRASALALSSRA